jgi:hypothetical protein
MSNMDIGKLAVSQANFPEDQLLTCIGICLAESGGVANIMSDPNTDGSIDLGLWQINSKAHADILKGADWWVPSVNAGLMMKVSNNGRVWTPWTTYNNGAYKHTSAGTPPDAASGTPGTFAAGAVPNPVSTVQDAITGGLNAITSTFTKIAGNVIATLLALVLLVVGVLLIMEKPLVGTAKKLPKVLPI